MGKTFYFFFIICAFFIAPSFVFAQESKISQIYHTLDSLELWSRLSDLPFFKTFGENAIWVRFGLPYFPLIAGIIFILNLLFFLFFIFPYILSEVPYHFLPYEATIEFGGEGINGIVIDSITRRPLAKVIVRIIDRYYNKAKETQITDKEGRFNFFVAPGKYTLSFFLPGYVFPSVIPFEVARPNIKIYRGGIFVQELYKEKAQNFLVPLDPEYLVIREQKINLWVLQIARMIYHAILKSCFPLQIAALLAALILMLFLPSFPSFLILILYVAVFILQSIIDVRVKRSMGKVLDKESKKPVGLAIVRLFKKINKKTVLLGTKITDLHGQFFFLVDPGVYFVTVTKKGYKEYKSFPIRYHGFHKSILNIEAKIEKE